MATTIKDLTVYRGDTTTVPFEHSFTSVIEARFYVRKKPDDQLLVRVRKSTEPAQWSIDTSAGTGTLTIKGSDTAPVAPGEYYYDIELTDGTTTTTVQRGRFVLEGDIATDVSGDAIPTLEYHVTADQRDALNAANSPSASNAIATMADIALHDTFLELTDTPSAYTGAAGKGVAVNSGETGLEFVAFAAAAHTHPVADLTDHDKATHDALGIDAATLGGQLPSYYAPQSELDAHTGDTSNPHAVTYTQVGAAAASHTHPVADLTDHNKSVHDALGIDAATLGGQLPSYYATAADLSAHTSDTSNPHSVTAAQTTIADAGGYYTATDVEGALQEIGSGTTLDGRYVNVAGDTLTGTLTTANVNLYGQIRTDRVLNSDTNTIVGFSAGASLSHSTGSEGWYNSAFGQNALYSNTRGYSNTAMGAYALNNNTEGNHNTGVGRNALYSNTTGSYNTGVGRNALYNNTIGSYNTGVGRNAGRYIADGITDNATSSNCVFLGAHTKASADGVTNEIVIGYNATGSGSNTATYGNASITEHVFASGALRLSETTPPPAPGANQLRIYANDDGAGVTEYSAVFATGDVLVLGRSGLTVPTYTTANVTATRSLDVSTATLSDVANVLGTLIQDLQARRLIKPYA